MQSTWAGQEVKSSYFASRLTLVALKHAPYVNTMILRLHVVGLRYLWNSDNIFTRLA